MILLLLPTGKGLTVLVPSPPQVKSTLGVLIRFTDHRIPLAEIRMPLQSMTIASRQEPVRAL